MLVALFFEMGFICANKPQIKQTSCNIHSRGSAKWKHVPLHRIAWPYRKDSPLQTGRQRTQSWGGDRATGLRFPLWSGNGSMPRCPVACCKFSCKNHRGTVQACLRVSIITFSWDTGTWEAYELQQLCITQFSSQVFPTLLLNTQYFTLYSSFHVSLISHL